MTHWSADELLVSPGKIYSRYLNIETAIFNLWRES